MSSFSNYGVLRTSRAVVKGVPVIGWHPRIHHIQYTLQRQVASRRTLITGRGLSRTGFATTRDIAASTRSACALRQHIPTVYSQSRRGLATTTDFSGLERENFAAVVVGAGPAGIAVTGNLLDRKVGPILWVDEKFDAGRVNRSYREVPSNTKTQLFIDFAEAVDPLKRIANETPGPNAITALRELDPKKGCKLSYAADMLLMLTNGLKAHPSVSTNLGRLRSATLDPSASGGNRWTIDLAPTASAIVSPKKAAQTSGGKIQADRVILCTGSSPRTRPFKMPIPGLRTLDLDTALTPSMLSKQLSKTSSSQVAVIGASHSAILALLNLSHLGLTSHPDLRVKWFTRHPLRYAEFRDGWIKRDNTGLKGEAADFARENLEDGEVFERSDVSKVVEKIRYEANDEDVVLAQNLAGVDYVVHAVGFDQDELPGLYWGQGSGKGRTEMKPFYNHLSGAFKDGAVDGRDVAGLYGAGIAWPERVTDPEGNVEYAVGFWKFMRFIKRVSPDWN